MAESFLVVNQVERVRVLPGEFLAWLDGHGDIRLQRQDGANRPQGNSGERSVARDVEARSHLLVLDGEPVVGGARAESLPFGVHRFLVFEGFQVHELVATDLRQSLVESLLRFDLENENETIKNYRERVRRCEALGEYAMSEQIRQILVDEQDHQIDLATALGVEVPDVGTARSK